MNNTWQKRTNHPCHRSPGKRRLRKSAWPKTDGTHAIPRRYHLSILPTVSGATGQSSSMAARRLLHSCDGSGQKSLIYRLIKEVWASPTTALRFRFAYEWHDDAGNWFRSYGNENWEFAPNGQMQRRFASINDLPIKEADRKYHWPLGPRPENHPGLPT